MANERGKRRWLMGEGEGREGQEAYEPSAFVSYDDLPFGLYVCVCVSVCLCKIPAVYVPLYC